MSTSAGDARRAILVVHSKPVEGREDEYDAWYSDVHLPEVVRLDGFVAARRFRLVDDGGASAPVLPFLAVYEVEAGRIGEARAALAAALESSRQAVADGRMPVLATSAALHERRDVAWFEEIATTSRDDPTSDG